MSVLYGGIGGVLNPADAINHITGWFCWLYTLLYFFEGHSEVRHKVHSRWRYEHQDDGLRQLLGPFVGWFAGSAPRIHREHALHAVLQANKGVVKSYLVLDDDAKEFEGTHWDCREE